MQRLTYPRTIVVRVMPSTRDVLVDFYRSPPRSWKLEQGSKSVSELKFYRGNWKESPLPSWFAKTTLSSLFAKRRPLKPSRTGASISLESWPAELFVTMKSKDMTFEISIVYEVAMIDKAEPMSRDDKKKWRAAVDEDCHAAPR